MLTLKFQKFTIPLKERFTISRYSRNEQKTFIVSISCKEYTGYGEATVNPYYGSTLERLEKSVINVKDLVNNSANLHPSALWELLKEPLKKDYFALCAIDCAFWDWYAQKKKKPMRRFWSAKDNSLPKTNYTIGIDSIDIMKQKILDFPWPIYKIKLGTNNDLEIIKELRMVTEATFRVDANCAWTVEETIKNAEILKQLGVEFIEQPLPRSDWKGMERVKKFSSLPIIADESCITEEDVDRCVGLFDGINIKLMKCGGITPALRMINRARKFELKVMAGCMTESTIGISALCQLAPLLDYIDADGALLFKEDIANGVTFDKGSIIFASKDGSGAKLKQR